MQKKPALDYHQITEAAENQLRMMAEISFEQSRGKRAGQDKTAHWKTGVFLFWRSLTGDLLACGDKAAIKKRGSDSVRLENLFDLTLEKLREEAGPRSGLLIGKVGFEGKTTQAGKE